MIKGFNTDVTYHGMVLHVQTEDRGLNNPKIVTTIYIKGEIIDTRTLSYDDIIASSCVEEVVKELMEKQHQKAIQDILDGKIISKKIPTLNELLYKRIASRKKLEDLIIKYISNIKNNEEKTKFEDFDIQI